MKTNIDMTAAEIGYLWSTYQAETLKYCLLKYFDRIVEDPDIKKINTLTMNSVNGNITKLKEIFKYSNFPIPIGFKESDVMLDSKRLYTDPFILYFQWFVAKGNMNYGSLAINTIAREDIFNFYENFLSNSLKLLKDSRELLLAKGLWIRAPYIPLPKDVSFVKKESFLNGWLGVERPIAGIEIASVFYNLITNSLGLSLMNSFIQVTKTKELRDYFKRGKDIAEKHVRLMSERLNKENLPTPNTWNRGITDSLESPFSEKLMLFFISFLNAQGISNYGNAVSNSIRHDIGIDFTRLAAEVSKFGEDGTELLIKYGWFECPPKAMEYQS
ncbi:DUF3231 family protein [Metabacillus litoralis]|uniref:DUF3231 family protein n=1 Tax=Metabacillus litoralis TaxID=152268 RepID=UPI001CFD6660|nr:DUF3231 family protein [Metabacillus litoralis]